MIRTPRPGIVMVALLSLLLPPSLWGADGDGDGIPESLPVSQVVMPGNGRIYLYSATANEVTLERSTGSDFTEIDGSPFPIAADTRIVLPLSAGYYRLTGRAPFVYFISDDSTNGDAITGGVGVDGRERADTLLVWAGEYVVVLAGEGAPGRVSLQRYTGGGFEEIGGWESPGPRSVHTFSVPTFDLYKVTAEEDAILAIGSSLRNAQNNFTYLPSANGTDVGLRYTYLHPEIIGKSTLYFENLYTGRTTVGVFKGETELENVTLDPGEVHGVPLQSGTLYRLEANWQLLVWVESDPNNGSCDGTILDADFVPGTRGTELDTTFQFVSTVTSGTCYPDRRSDIDLFGYADGTEVTIVKNGVSTEKTLMRGERFRVQTDMPPATRFEIEASKEISVQMTHQRIEFAQSGFPFYEDPILGEDNCPDTPNPDQSDRDLDGAGDRCDCAPDDPNMQTDCAPCAAVVVGRGKAASGWSIVPFLSAFLLLRRRRRLPGD